MMCNVATDTLAGALRAEIDRRELTGSEAADQLGVSQPTVSRWLGGSPPDDDRVEVIAAFINRPPGEVERLVFQARRRQRDQRREVTRQGAGADTDRGPGDDDIELDFNSAMEHVPDEVRQAVIRIVKPYLEGG